MELLLQRAESEMNLHARPVAEFPQPPSSQTTCKCSLHLCLSGQRGPADRASTGVLISPGKQIQCGARWPEVSKGW